MTSVFYRDIGKNYPKAISSKGMFVRDEDGKDYLDMSGGAAVSSLGHGHPAVVDALKNQIDTMAFAHTGFFTNGPQEKLAELLSSFFGEENARVYFTSGGSEANETALKMAWQYWRAVDKPQKVKILSREHSYHGNTFGVLSASGNPARRAPMDHVLLDWPRLSPCYAYRGMTVDEDTEVYVARLADEFEHCIAREGADTIAAVILEPVVGASLGVVPAVEGYLKSIRALCDRYEILMISDEIMCGSGRTGTFYAHEQDGIIPDIVTLAKGIAGGYQPLAATIVREKIHAIFETSAPFDHGHTYVGHASACAAGLAVLETIIDEKLLDNVNSMGCACMKALVERYASKSYVGDIRGRGLFFGIEFVADKQTKAPHKQSLMITKKLKKASMGSGLICYPGGGSEQYQLGSHILFAPPYIMEQKHIGMLTDKFDQVLTEVFGE